MRILRHLSFSNVIAMLALFVALGGAAYAGTKISGSSIKNGSIGGGKLKDETITAGKIKKGTITGAQIASQSITGAQIQPGSIDGSEINVANLGTVPLAQAAQTAANATKADTATSATHADAADNATHADAADNAAHADAADNATHADAASTADSATAAGHATTAGEAEKLGGKTAEQFELSCKGGTEFYGGMCWEETSRPPQLWPVAVHECGEAGGRLPSIEELIAFALRDHSPLTGEAWSGDLDSIEANPPSKVEVVFTTDEVGLARTRGAGSGLLGYRCVFPRSN